MPAGFVDQPRVFHFARRVERQRLVPQHVGKADDGVERRAQFVAHDRKEAAFGGVGALRFGLRHFERAVLRLALAHVAQHRHHFAGAAAGRFSGRQRISTQTNCGGPDRPRRGGCGIRACGPRRCGRARRGPLARIPHPPRRGRYGAGAIHLGRDALPAADRRHRRRRSGGGAARRERAQDAGTCARNGPGRNRSAPMPPRAASSPS